MVIDLQLVYHMKPPQGIFTLDKVPHERSGSIAK